jgi:hypothetical protein
VCDIAAGRSINRERINRRNSERALAMVNALKTHAYKLYSTFEIEEDKRDATTDKIIKYLAGKKLPVKIRDITFHAGGKPPKDEIKRSVKGIYQISGSNVIRRLF